MESQGQQTGGGGGTDATGEGEDEESSSSSSSPNIADKSIDQIQLRSLLEDEQQQENQSIERGEEGGESENVLEQFRRQWRNELQKVSSSSKSNSRDASPSILSLRSSSSKETTPSIAAAGGPSEEDSSKKSSSAAAAESDSTVVQSADSITKKPTAADSELLERASGFFQNGIEMERQGKMYEAIRFYRQAVQLVPDIEKRLASSVGGGRTYAMVASEGIAERQQRGYDESDVQEWSTPEELIEIFRNRLLMTTGGRSLCLPAVGNNEDGDDGEEDENGDAEKDERERRQSIDGNTGDVHISQLPVEVLMHIFKWVVSSDLDLRQLEQLSMVCCGFYIATRDPELWRLACLKTWGVRLGVLDSSMYQSWRQMFIERPHVWYSGVYISKITYVRHGETAYQDQFYRPWHLVVYYRYLRFFADGTMLMLTTPEDPSTIVQGLRWKQARFQGIVKGTYRLVGHNCIAGVLVRKTAAESNASAPSYSRNNRSIAKQPNDLMEYVFSLVLNINSIKRRRHVQLSWSSYEVTTRYRNGQTSMSKFDLSDENFPPMYLSRVKAYTIGSESPLE